MPDASKAAFVRLVEQLRSWGITLVDSQVYTQHVARFGATEWPRLDYMAALKKALAKKTRQGLWAFDAEEAAPTRAAAPPHRKGVISIKLTATPRVPR